ncbi:MAG: hypothetical protein QHH19_01400 [Candidatus Thermoplasmatota archaeon]|nr:hypothetical protein [Candidatus Thermoplasmatota archaeon]
MFHEEKKPLDYNKIKFSNKRKKMKIVVIVIIVLSIVSTIGVLAYNAGFIPITGFLDVKAPPGSYVELNAEEFIEKYPQINDMPNLDKIKYRFYGADESVDSIANYYKEKLGKEGYSLVREGTIYLDKKTFHYYGFLKGLTAVGVLLASVADEEFGYNTLVVYTTGNALDYKEILDWYQNQT